jgi:YidC/Oxa1 family membrane protein insertase
MLNDQDNQKNLLLAIVLSVGVLLAWQVFYAGPKLKDDQERRQRIQQEQSQVKEQPGAPKTGPVTAPGAVPQPGAVVPSAAPRTTRPYARRGATDGCACAHRDPSLRGSIALAGGRLDDLCWPNTGRRSIPNRPMSLFSPSGAPHPYYAEYGMGGGQRCDTSDARHATRSGARRKRHADAGLAGDAHLGQRRVIIFRRTIAVDADYLFTVTEQVENKTGAEISLASLLTDLPPRHAED